MQLTPLYTYKRHNPVLLATSIIDGKFSVYSDEDCDFYWHVYGERLSIEVEPLKSLAEIKGQGPYKYL